MFDICIYSLYILFQKNLEANDIFHPRGIFIINCSQFASRKVIKIAIFKRNLLNEVKNAPSTVIPERTLVSQLTFTYSKSTIELLQKCELCSKLTIKTPERRPWRLSCVFIVNFEHIAHLFLVFLLLTLNK